MWNDHDMVDSQSLHWIRFSWIGTPVVGVRPQGKVLDSAVRAMEVFEAPWEAVALERGCYCEGKILLRVVDMLTYPRPVRKFEVMKAKALLRYLLMRGTDPLCDLLPILYRVYYAITAREWECHILLRWNVCNPVVPWFLRSFMVDMISEP